MQAKKQTYYPKPSYSPTQQEQPQGTSQVLPPQQVQSQGLSLKEIAIYSGITLVAGTLAFLGIRKVIRKIGSNQEEKKTLDNTKEATYAKRLNMAFDNDGWPGTDEEAIRRVLREIPSREFFRAVEKSYKKNFHRHLATDMAAELTSTEYSEMLNILSGKPEKTGGQPVYNYDAWAKRLRAATEQYYMGIWPATDEDAIKAVFMEIPSYTAYAKVKAAYKRIYGDDLYQDLLGEMWQSEVDALVQMVKRKGA